MWNSQSKKTIDYSTHGVDIKQCQVIGDNGIYVWGTTAGDLQPTKAEIKNISDFLDNVPGNRLSRDGLSIAGYRFKLKRGLPGDNYFIASPECKKFQLQYLVAHRMRSATFIVIGSKKIKTEAALLAVEAAIRR